MEGRTTIAIAHRLSTILAADVIFVLEGRGYSLVEGERFDWEAGDLLLLPMKPGGVAHQHFNLESDKPSRWLAFISNAFREHTGYEIVQIEESPDWKTPGGP